MLEAIDDSLSVLGDQPRKALYQYLSTIHSLQREDIPEKIDEFSLGLKKALGGASKVIERLIVRRLFQRIGTPFRESRENEFIDYVEDAKRRFEVVRQRHGMSDDLLEHSRSKKSQVPG